MLPKTRRWRICRRKACSCWSAIIGRQGAEGEIDLILRERDGTVVFVEVRSRSSNAFGGAGSSIGAIKQQRVVFAAPLPAALRVASAMPLRCGPDRGQVQWIKAAFDAQ